MKSIPRYWWPASKQEVDKKLDELQFQMRLAKERGEREREKILCSAIMKLKEGTTLEPREEVTNNLKFTRYSLI
jgi:hypothetical protein